LPNQGAPGGQWTTTPTPAAQPAAAAA
jgi:hypothetical protein